MAYLTPQRFVQEFGIDQMAQLLRDPGRLLTSDLLASAIAGTLPPAPTDTITQPMLDAANAALAHFARKVITVGNYMDGFLRSAVQLPLADDDANQGVLEECCLALVREGLASSSDNATELMTKTADKWRTWLRDVAASRVQLVRSDTGESPAPARRVRSGGTRSHFDWAFKRDFGSQGGEF